MLRIIRFSLRGHGIMILKNSYSFKPKILRKFIELKMRALLQSIKTLFVLKKVKFLDYLDLMVLVNPLHLMF